MANHKTSLEAFEREIGETIQAIVVGKHDNAAWDAAPKDDENVILSRESGLKKLDEEYYDGHGGADCFPFYAWTESFVVLVHEYDGATSLGFIPRVPMAVEPAFDGMALYESKVFAAAKALKGGGQT